MEKEKLILGYNTIINARKLGFTHFRVFLNLMDMNSSRFEELVDFLKKRKNVWWIAKCDGAWSFAFSMWAESNEEFREFYTTKFLPLFRENIKEQLICPLTKYKHFSKTYLIDGKKLGDDKTWHVKYITT